MKYGIIDIGSNTVRAVVYEVENGITTAVSNIAAGSKLFNFTENSILTDSGISWLLATVSSLIKSSKEQCAFTAFATSAFRDISNKKDVAEMVETVCGVKVYILSGDEEAECDRIALTNKGINSATAVDLGGGSCQIIAFDEKCVSLAVSLPLGCVRLKRQFVMGEFPEDDEMERIYKHTETTVGKSFKESEKLVIFGGTARNLARLATIKGLEETEDEMSIETLKELTKIAKDESGKELIKSIAGKRYETVLVGACTLLCIAKKCKAGKIILPDVSVRDGFLMKYVLN